MFGEKTLVKRETETYTRMGDKDEIRVDGRGHMKFKYVQAPYSKVQRLYNSKEDLVCLDVIEVNPKPIEVIYNNRKRTVVVILTDEDDNKFKGVSKCHIEDRYIPQVGYDVAYNRALIGKTEHILSELMK